MGICINCGNDYDETFTVIMKGQSYEFDCFECAIHHLAPSCRHCGTRILGHGAQDGDVLFCSAHCARQEGDYVLNDRHQTPRLHGELDFYVP